MQARYLIIWIGLLSGCAATKTLRPADQNSLGLVTDERCGSVFQTTDDAILSAARNYHSSVDDRNAFLATETQAIAHVSDAQRPCWASAYEHHEKYDLFYAEFDDEGNATDVASGGEFQDSQLHFIESTLSDMVAKLDTSVTGLNIVVFTHGWHGSASATDDYSVELKAILEDLTDQDEAIRGHRRFGGDSHKDASKAFRTVGIELAWRGDSVVLPPKLWDVWDRKVAAQTISGGSVQELLAFLNQVYVDRSCKSVSRGTVTQENCGDVHLLSLGHSYGALINFRALAPRLESGLNVDQCERISGFGDMTILLNPAFEAQRYRALFNTALNRPVLRGDYLNNSGPPQNCKTTSGEAYAGAQIPMLVTLQSAGDTATGTWMPLFLRIAQPFASTLSVQEAREENHALGWVDAFQTHTLDFNSDDNAKDSCLNDAPSFCPFAERRFGPKNTDQADPNGRIPLILNYTPGGKSAESLPAFFPLWSVKVNKQIMHDHDDIWNPQIVWLINRLFQDAYVQSEVKAGRLN